MPLRKSLALLIPVLFLLPLFITPAALASPASPIVLERGSNYIISDLGGGKRSWESAPQYVFNGVAWVPYIYSRDDAKKCYNIQVGFVAARIYDTGVVEIYDPSLSEVRIKGETWEVWAAGKKATLNSPITWSVVTNSSGVFITRRQTTSKPDGALEVIYSFLVDSPLKHTVTWTSTGTGTVSGVQVRQIHLMDFDKVTTDTGTVTASKSEKSGAYLFSYGSKDFWVLENQYAMVYDTKSLTPGTLLTEKCLQTGEIDFAGKKVTYTFGDWTLASGKSLEIDPNTATLNNPTEDGYVYFMTPNYTRDSTSDYIQSSYSTGMTSRGYVQWGVSSIPDTATITDTVFKYDGHLHETDCHIHAMAAAPSGATNPNLYADIADGTIYADVAGFPVAGTNKEIDLGATADSDLQGLLASNWFAIGIQSDNEATSAMSLIHSEENVDATPKPTLYVVYTLPPPTNGAGTIDDMDDTNNLYAQRKLYTGTSAATDTNGYADIHYMEFRIKQGAATRAIFRYHQDDDTFSVESGSTEWTLDASSSDSSVGNTITVTWKFTAQWDAIEEADLEIELYCVDAAAASDTDTAQTNYFDVVKTLTISGFASNPVTYCLPSSTVIFTGTVYYVNNPGGSTATTFYPPDAEFTAVHVHDAAHASQGNDATIVNGAFSVSIAAPAPPGVYTYHPYINMVDADYVDADVPGITDSIEVVAGLSIASASIIDMDDTDNVYAMKKYYSFQVVIGDSLGATDIDAISVRGMQGASVRWMVNATDLDGTPAYAIVTGSSTIDLDVPACSFTEDGNYGTLILAVRFEWDYSQEEDCELSVWASSVLTGTAGWITMQTDYFDVITRLVTYNFGANVTSTTISTPIALSGFIRYATTTTENLASSSYPPNDQFTSVSIQNDQDEIKGTDTTVLNGFFDIAFNSSILARTTYYYAYLNMLPDYTDGLAPDGDYVAVTTISTYHESNLINQAFAYYGLVTANILSVLTAFATYFASSATTIISLITSIMTAVIFVAGSLIYWLNLFVNFFVNLFTIIGNIINGTTAYTTGLGNIWNLIGFATWASAVPVFAFIFWVNSVSSRTAKSGRSNIEIMVGDLQIVTYLVGEVWNWTYMVFNFVVNMIMTFLSVIIP